MKRILFVCTGNTCRSPLAEHLLKSLATDTFEVQSAGIAALQGDDAAEHVHQVLEEIGINIKHQAQMVTPELIDWADLVLTMTKQHEQILQDSFPEQGQKIIALKVYVGDQATDHTAQDVVDPYGGSIDVYRQTRNELKQLLQRLLEKEQGSTTEK